ncbi:hypothetical protein [Candidatus Magnetobacterium casense]|uniref:Uncharacterized protein n=1 Tax=Candidatus Magnetobacterium casense TaxID=1455061 RepID=A0ABS6S1U3_9BACT|nr:hypothetical protein [Candidatus Magnetobacterium casensis]MBV6342822.1 hypothetical protein [Candidatus Magnetobacterium casensis]
MSEENEGLVSIVVKSAGDHLVILFGENGDKLLLSPEHAITLGELLITKASDMIVRRS